RQGEIHLVLNAEPDSFAREHYTDHGPSICAVSLRTDDSTRALNRATSLHCPRFDSRIGPHELRIPAIRAPDGSLVYFVSAAPGASVHHLAFSCAHIFSPVAKLSDNGVDFVTISDNYYDDLPTRFELDESMVAQLQSLAILYERSSYGEYFHIYTEEFAGRFFF